jgi:hypothetical protein
MVSSNCFVGTGMGDISPYVKSKGDISPTNDVVLSMPLFLAA